MVEELRRRDPSIEVAALGGDALARAGAQVLESIADNPVMGFSAVFRSLGYFVRLLSNTGRFLEAWRPDLLLLVDYPGFNVNLARLARRMGIRTCYYICPQYWGWAPWRARRFAQAVDHALVIFPFECPFLASLGIEAEFVGHPVADRVHAAAQRGDERRRIALLPGSRRLEVKRHLDWLIATAQGLETALCERLEFCSTHPRPALRETLDAAGREAGIALTVESCPLPDLLATCRLAMVSSGTATLEAALLGVPSIVVYQIHRCMDLGSRFLLTSPFIAQPNLLAGYEIFPEFLASTPPIGTMVNACVDLYRDGPQRTRVLAELADLRRRILHPGADLRAASAVAALLPTGPGR